MDKRLQFVIFLVLAIGIIALILLVPAVNQFDQRVTGAIFSFFYGYQYNWLTGFMNLVTENAYLFVIAIFAYTLSEKHFGKAFRFVAYVLIIWGMITVLQQWLGRPRPFVTVEQIQYLTKFPELSFGLPSGHATMAFFVATYFVEELKGYGIKHWLLDASALFVAIFIAFTRVYLGVHYLGDVVSGAFLGLALGILFTYFDAWLITKLPLRRNTSPRSK